MYITFIVFTKCKTSLKVSAISLLKIVIVYAIEYSAFPAPWIMQMLNFALKYKKGVFSNMKVKKTKKSVNYINQAYFVIIFFSNYLLMIEFYIFTWILSISYELSVPLNYATGLYLAPANINRTLSHLLIAIL